MSDQPRQPSGTPAGGRFANIARAESTVTLGSRNRYEHLNHLHELDNAAIGDLDVPAADPAAAPEGHETRAAIRSDWEERRTAIFNCQRRERNDLYSQRREDEAYRLLESAARANLLNIADALREAFPDAATMTLKKDYDDGNLALWVSSVRDADGNDLDDPDDGSESARDLAQELVSGYESARLARFADEPVDLAEASRWTPPEGPSAFFR